MTTPTDIVEDGLWRTTKVRDHTFSIVSENVPPDDGIAVGHSKFWLTVAPGKSAIIQPAIAALIYINGVPRVFSFPGDQVAIKVALNGRQSLRVTKANRARDAK